MKKLVAFLLICMHLQQLFAVQNKYALLIGINLYQKVDEKGNTVLDPKNALYGCVNDAKSMRDLLMNKFDFPKNNITTLYDTSATKNNIFKEIDKLRMRCKAGDVAVIYYAGHGMPFRYGKGTEDIAEIILPCNAFTAVPFSYIQQTELAKKFNLFVDKNIILTTIFDCCFSLGTDKHGAIMIPPDKKDSLHGNINTDDDDWTEPVSETPLDANEFNLLNNPDSIDAVAKSENALSKNNVQNFIQNRGLSQQQYEEMTRNITPSKFNDIDTTYNPPSQRENSQFIFLSATNDKQVAPEMRNESGVSHGAFTNALIKIFEDNPSYLPLTQVFKKIAIQLKRFGKNITPSARYKPGQREDKNIFGINSNDLKLKVYLDSSRVTFDDLNAMYKKWVMPLNTNYSKPQLLIQNNDTCSKIYIMNNGKNVFYIDAKTKKTLIISNVETLKKKLNGKPYFIYLPVPKIVNDNIKKECLKNPKIQLVNDINKADVSVYCTNYSPQNTGIINKMVTMSSSLVGNYKNELSFVGSNETVGVKRNRIGHYFSASGDIVVPASDALEGITKKIMIWLSAKSGK